MLKEDLEKALNELDAQIVDEVSEARCEKRLALENKTTKTKDQTKTKAKILRFRAALIAAVAVLLAAVITIPLVAGLMNKAPEPETQVPVVTETEKTTAQTEKNVPSETPVTPTPVTPTPTETPVPTETIPTETPVTPTPVPTDTTTTDTTEYSDTVYVDGCYYLYDDALVCYTLVDIDAGVENVVLPDYIDGIPVAALDVEVVASSGAVSLYLPETVRIFNLENFLKPAISRYGSLKTITVSENNPYFKAQGGCLVALQDGGKHKANELILGVGDAVIPDDGSVTAIGEKAFWRSEDLTSITIPDSVTTIGEYAFAECPALCEVHFGAGVKSVGDCAFWNCGLEVLTLNEGLESIGAGAFSNSNLVEIALPSSIKTIGPAAFCYDRALERVILPDGFQTLNANVFEGPHDLKYIRIPESLKYLDLSALGFCENMEELYIPANCTLSGSFHGAKPKNFVVSENNPNYYVKSGCLFSTIGNKLMYVSQNGILPDDGSVTVIGCNAFSFGTQKEVVVPDSVVKIEESAFANCQIETIVLPKNCMLEDGSFRNCRRLKSVEIPGCNETLNCAFSDCSALERVILDEGVKHIEAWAFRDCKNLKYISLPSTLEQIGTERAPDAYTNAAFLYGLSIDEIVLSPDNPYYCLKDGCLIDRRTHTLVLATADCTIPGDGEIEEIATDSCLAHVTEFIVPEGVKRLTFSFSDCPVERVVLSDSVEAIYQYTFPGESGKVKEIVIGKGVKYIDEFAFDFGRWSLVSVTVDEENPYYKMVDGCLVDVEKKLVLLTLEGAVIPTDGSVTAILEYAMVSDSFGSVKDIEIPDGVKIVEAKSPYRY